MFMVFFDKFFGRRNYNVPPPEKTMDDDSFWGIVQTSFDKAKGDFEKQQDELKKLLSRLSPSDVLLFDNKFRQLRGEAYDWRLWGAAYIIRGWCGDDSFMDFRDWVIAQGKAFYYKALDDPKTLVDVDKERININWEGMGYVPMEVFKALTGKDMPGGIDVNHDIKGEEWSTEGELERLFPKLWAKYS